MQPHHFQAILISCPCRLTKKIWNSEDLWTPFWKNVLCSRIQTLGEIGLNSERSSPLFPVSDKQDLNLPCTWTLWTACFYGVMSQGLPAIWSTSDLERTRTQPRRPTCHAHALAVQMHGTQQWGRTTVSSCCFPSGLNDKKGFFF